MSWLGGMYLAYIRVGDKIAAGGGFRGPNKLMLVTGVRDDGGELIEVDTEGGTFAGGRWSMPDVALPGDDTPSKRASENR